MINAAFRCRSISRSAPGCNSMVAAVRPALLPGEVKNDIRFRDAADQAMQGRVVDNWQTLRSCFRELLKGVPSTTQRRYRRKVFVHDITGDYHFLQLRSIK